MSLYNKIIDLQKLNMAWQHVKRNHPADGVDNVTYEEFDEKKKVELYNLYLELKNHSYESLPAREVVMYKGTKARTIALFCMRDKVVQQSLAYELNQIYDDKFSESVYAYRTGKSALNAVEQIEQATAEYSWALKLDIEHFFDSINHEKLISMLHKVIAEEDVLELIKDIIRAKALDTATGELRIKERGVYQGSGIAPILSNIYMMEFDRIISDKADFYIRYSDDILILGRSEAELKQLENTVYNILSSLELGIQNDKSELTSIDRGFKYLGYEFDCSGKCIPEKAEHNLEMRLEDMWFAEINTPIDIKLKKGSEILGGWEQYYRGKRIPGSMLEYAVVLYMTKDKEQVRDKIIAMRFDYVNVHKDLMEYFVGIWSRWSLSDYVRREYEQFLQILNLDKDNNIDSSSALHEELLRYLSKVTIHPAVEDYDNLIQLYSDFHCYNKALYLHKQRALMLDMSNTGNAIMYSKANSDGVNNYRYSDTDIVNYMNLFVAREDVYARESGDNSRRKFETVYEALTDNEVKQHLDGQLTVATYIQRSNSTVSYMVFDIDVSKKIMLSYSFGSPEFESYINKAADTAAALRKCIGNTGIQSYVEFSGCRGYHVWVFFTEWIPVRYVNMLQDCYLKKMAQKSLIVSDDIQIECFPNKAHVRSGKMGQCIKLPYGIHSKSGKCSYFLDNDGRSVEDIGKFLKDVARYSLRTLKTIIGSHIEAEANDNEGMVHANKRLATFDKELEGYGKPGHAIEEVLRGCTLMRYLCEKAKNTGYLNHFERLSVLYVFGHIGDEGKGFVHTVMEFTLNYQYDITEKFIKRLPAKPVSCIKLRDQYKTVTAEYGCNCNFKRTKNCYPSPVLHAIKKSDDSIDSITMPTSRTLTKEKEKQIYDELNIHKKVQDMSNRIVELKKQKRGIDKSIVKLESELERIFDNAGIDCMEIEMGLLVRRKVENGYEWLVEL